MMIDDLDLLKTEVRLQKHQPGPIIADNLWQSYRSSPWYHTYVYHAEATALLGAVAIMLSLGLTTTGMRILMGAAFCREPKEPLRTMPDALL